LKRRSRGKVDWAWFFQRMRDRLDGRLPRQPLPSVSMIALGRQDPFRVLVATEISLRTKDEVTTPASKRLLAEAPTPKRLAALSRARIEKLIYPAGFYRVKAANLREMARILISSHGGKVPSGMEDLLELPGVGRKTANLVRNLGFGIPAICVDTHVHRVSNRLGWVSTRTPERTETALMEKLPKKYWIPINELLVRFGQSVCTPLSPICSACPVSRRCPRAGVVRSR
jgi:endonuclease-3